MPSTFEQGMIDIGCMTHARRKFFDLHMANTGQLAEQALLSMGGLYEAERQVRRCSASGFPTGGQSEWGRLAAPFALDNSLSLNAGPPSLRS